MSWSSAALRRDTLASHTGVLRMASPHLFTLSAIAIPPGSWIFGRIFSVARVTGAARAAARYSVNCRSRRAISSPQASVVGQAERLGDPGLPHERQGTVDRLFQADLQHD